VLDGDHGSQTVGRFHDPSANLEPLHHGLLQRTTELSSAANPRLYDIYGCRQGFGPVVQSPARMRPLHIIGVSLDLGGNRRGVDMGPSAFRIAGLGERLATLGVPVTDDGDLVAPIPETKASGDPNKKYIREIARVCDKLYKTSLAALEKGGLPLVLG